MILSHFIVVSILMLGALMAPLSYAQCAAPSGALGQAISAAQSNPAGLVDAVRAAAASAPQSIAAAAQAAGQCGEEDRETLAAISLMLETLEDVVAEGDLSAENQEVLQNVVAVLHVQNETILDRVL